MNIRKLRPSRLVLFGLLASTLCFSLYASRAHANRMALWNIVHGQCEPHFEAGQGPAPCADVDEADGVALLKDLHGVAQELAIPTRRVTGIEDPALLQPDAPNYFAYAWRERAAVEALLKHPLPREAVGISVNSMYSRSQDQLHLHIDCMDKEVAAALASYSKALDETFRLMTIELRGRRYWARRLDSADLSGVTPFQLLADGIEGAKGEMGFWALAAIGANFEERPGFILLADRVGWLGGGGAENLQDHDCAF
jgi:CDP-diacylglycerol pyrophosphatase